MPITRMQTQTTATTALPRGRTRRIMVSDAAPAPVAVQPVAPTARATAAVTPDMQELARQFFVANKASNAYNRQADAARKSLHKQMLASNVETFRTAVEIDGSVAQIEARIDQPDSDVISVEKLRALVDEDTFMKIVSATKTAVTAHAGTNVMVASTVTVPGKADLRIKEVAL